MDHGRAVVIYFLGIISGVCILPAVLFTHEHLLPRPAKTPAPPTVGPSPNELWPTAVAPGQMEDLKEIWLHLDAPSQLPYEKLDTYQPGSGRFKGQAGQDRWVDQVLQSRRKLFVVESGALNGINHSNPIFFETERDWECLLVEANPYLWPEVRARHRKCFFLSGGLSITKAREDFPFKLAGPLGGFTATMGAAHAQRAKAEIARQAPWMKGKQSTGEVIRVNAFPLDHVLGALNRSVVDYWSLDTEGSELQILKGSGLENIELGVLTVEHNNEKEKRDEIKEFLQQHGIQRVRAGGQDDFYANPSYFHRRGWPFPETSSP